MKVHSQGNRSKREYLRIPKPQAIVAGTIPPLNLDKKDAELFVTIKKKNKKMKSEEKTEPRKLREDAGL